VKKYKQFLNNIPKFYKNVLTSWIKTGGGQLSSPLTFSNERSINLNKVVATFEKHKFLSQTDLTRTGIISNSYNEIFEA
jgi:hypothetical protein